MAQECRASIAHRIAYIFRDALRRLDSPLLSVQRKARARLPVAAKPVASYIMCTRVGNLIYTGEARLLRP